MNSDTDSDGSFLYSEPSSPTTISPNDSQLDDDALHRRLHPHGDAGTLERRHPRLLAGDSTVDDATKNEPPRGSPEWGKAKIPWFDVDESFKYDAILATAFLPMSVIAFGFVGETFLFLLGLGATLAHLLSDSGYELRAICVVCVTFFLSQFTLMFSAAPLLWSSISYAFLLFLLNSFAVLSAVWVFLHFRLFRGFDVELTVIMEKILFGASPLLALALQSWTFVNLFASSIALLPYFHLVIGFFYAQLFLAVRPSSFWRRRSFDDEDDEDVDEDEDTIANGLPPLVLPAEVTLIGSALYAFLPASVFLVVHLPGAALFEDWNFYLQFCFLLSLGIFCASLFFSVNDVASYLTLLDLTSRQVRTVKLISGGNSLLCGYLWTVNAISSGSGAWLAWLPLFTCIHVGVGAAAKQRNIASRGGRLALAAAGGLFIFAYAAFFTQFPLLRRARGLVFHFGTFSISIFAFVWILFLLAICSAAVVLLPVLVRHYRLPSAVAASFVVIHASLFNFAEMLLFLYDVYPFAFVLVSSVAFAFMHWRMLRVDATSSASTSIWICASLTFSKIYFATLIEWNDGAIHGESFLHFLVVFVVVAGASGLILYVIKSKKRLFSVNETDNDSAHAHRSNNFLLLATALLLQIAAHFVFVRPLWENAFNQDAMTFGDALSVHMILTGLIVKGLSTENDIAMLSSSISLTSSNLSLFYAYWFALSTAVFFFQPQLSANSVSLHTWTQLIGVASILHFLFLGVGTIDVRRATPWILYSYAAGIPLAFRVMIYVNIIVDFDLRTAFYVLTFIISTGLALGYLGPYLSKMDVDGSNTKSHYHHFCVRVAPKMKLSLICIVLSTALFEWTLASPPRRWNDVLIFRHGTPTIFVVASVLFPFLAALSKLNSSCFKDLIETFSSSIDRQHQPQPSQGSRTVFSKLLISVNDVFNAATLSNCLVFIDVGILVGCVDWSRLHSTAFQILCLLSSLHFILLRADPLFFSSSHWGVRVDQALFIIVAIFVYCGISLFSAVYASHFWRVERFSDAVFLLSEIVFSVTLVPCAALTAAHVRSDIFPTQLLSIIPTPAFVCAVFPSSVLLFLMATTISAKIVAVLEFIFSVVLISLHTIKE